MQSAAVLVPRTPESFVDDSIKNLCVWLVVDKCSTYGRCSLPWMAHFTFTKRNMHSDVDLQGIRSALKRHGCVQRGRLGLYLSLDHGRD